METLRPALFVAHGSPMSALEPGAAGHALEHVAHRIERPRAVVVVSPHWETAVPTVGSATRLDTIHDFAGFDPRLHDIRYPATGCPEAARQVVDALRDAGLPAELDAERGLDHGAWVPLRLMYPDADVPVVPLSVQHPGGPRHAWRVGQALAGLMQHAGFLLVGSGNITHNLDDWRQARMAASQGRTDTTPPYVRRFADWVHGRMTRREDEALLAYRTNEPSGRRAQPRDEHLLPLFTALGAAGPDARPVAFHRGVDEHVLAMDSYEFH
jgi:4,5-DOPA dioxygenase extradiol